VRNVFPSFGRLVSALQQLSISLQALEGSQEPSSVALVFGREESGLSHEELALCSHCCSIAASKACGSLNLSHAVAVILSQLYELQTEGALPLAPVQQHHTEAFPIVR
jgi:tRNA C32,U32 (ribose-2'-O)-methylase TrmJ